MPKQQLQVLKCEHCNHRIRLDGVRYYSYAICPSCNRARFRLLRPASPPNPHPIMRAVASSPGLFEVTQQPEEAYDAEII